MGGAVSGVLGAAGGIAGGILGNEMSRGDAGEARNQSIIANQILQQIKDSPDISKPLILEKYRQAGLLTPEMEQTITASEPKAISTDPAFKQAQMQALNQMQQRATGGLTAGDRAALQQSRLAAQGDTQSRLASIQQQAAMRGQAGGGSQLAMELAAAQGGANNESAQANQLAQMAQQAREQAVGQLGSFGSQLQQQEFGQGMQQQQAQQAMERFNIGNQIAQQQRNVGAANQAQAGNLANLQNVNNMNTQNSNAEQANQLQRQMQQAEYNRQNAQLKAGGANALSGTMSRSAAQQAQAGANIGAGLGGLASSAVSAFGSGGGGSTGGVTQAMHEGTDPDMYYSGGRVSFKQGGQVPGQAQVAGDHPVNDTVNAKLSPGEIVVPRSLAESKIGKEMLKLIHAHNSVKNKMNGSD